MKWRTTGKEIVELEIESKNSFVDWEENDTLVSYYRRKGMNSMADEFEKDYKRLGLPV